MWEAWKQGKEKNLKVIILFKDPSPCVYLGGHWLHPCKPGLPLHFCTLCIKGEMYLNIIHLLLSMFDHCSQIPLLQYIHVCDVYVVLHTDNISNILTLVLISQAFL